MKMGQKKMISAVICELNPLHFGHEFLLNRMKACSDAVVCILSGNFVQRGEPAVLDKWNRTRFALQHGADLVVELPLPWALAGAERFANGGVYLAAALGCSALAFGCETPDLPRLTRVADALLSPAFSQALKEPLSPGASFAVRREAAIRTLLSPEDAHLLQQPNCILGVEYLKAIHRQNAFLSPMVFPRVGAAHDHSARDGEFCSAGELRERLYQEESLSGLMPEDVVQTIGVLKSAGHCPASLALLERPILCRLRSMEAEAFSLLPDISEGLERKLYAASRQAVSLEELYGLAKSKRYSHARIRRLVMSAFLGLTADLPEFPPYLRPLGITEQGARILNGLSPTLPLAVRAADFKKLGGSILNLYRLECRADDLYAMAFPSPLPCGRDAGEKFIRL